MWILFKQNTEFNKADDLVDVVCTEEIIKLIEKNICIEVKNPHDKKIKRNMFLGITRRS